MGPDCRLNGREERRLPIMMEVNLAPVGHTNDDRCERTFTENMSPHGIRVQSTSAWTHGELADVTPSKGEVFMRGEVVYCQRVTNNRFSVGLKFPQGRIPWSILQRFNGLVLTNLFGAMRW